MTFTTPPLGPRRAQRRVERADRSTRGMLGIALALASVDILDWTGSDSLRRREARKMERAWVRVQLRWERMALKHADNLWPRGVEIAMAQADAAAQNAEDWRRFGQALE